MKKYLILLIAIMFWQVYAADNNACDKSKSITTIDEIKQCLTGGEWVSISVELRPELNLDNNTQGSRTIQPFYVKRFFKYLPNDAFEGSIISYADPYGETPLVKFVFKGHVVWGAKHKIAEGAYNLDYVLDEGFEVTPLNEMFVELLNSSPTKELKKWKINVMQDIKGKEFPLFRIKKGQILKDHDLIYINHGMLFMGSKHVDGRGFDKPENRPTNLQIPLIKK